MEINNLAFGVDYLHENQHYILIESERNSGQHKLNPKNRSRAIPDESLPRKCSESGFRSSDDSPLCDDRSATLRIVSDWSEIEQIVQDRLLGITNSGFGARLRPLIMTVIAADLHLICYFWFCVLKPSTIYINTGYFHYNNLCCLILFSNFNYPTDKILYWWEDVIAKAVQTRWSFNIKI